MPDMLKLPAKSNPILWLETDFDALYQTRNIFGCTLVVKVFFRKIGTTLCSHPLSFINTIEEKKHKSVFDRR
jgi:hypothetical protein